MYATPDSPDHERRIKLMRAFDSLPRDVRLWVSSNPKLVGRGEFANLSSLTAKVRRIAHGRPVKFVNHTVRNEQG